MEFAEVVDLEFYMKSGNIIKVDSVMTKFSITYANNVTGIKAFEQVRPRRRMFLQALQLDQIEAICYARAPYKKLMW